MTRQDGHCSLPDVAVNEKLVGYAVAPARVILLGQLVVVASVIRPGAGYSVLDHFAARDPAD